MYFPGTLRFSIGSGFIEKEETYPTGAYHVDLDDRVQKRQRFQNLLYNQLNNMMRTNRMGRLSVLTDVAEIVHIENGDRANVDIWVSTLKLGRNNTDLLTFEAKI